MRDPELDEPITALGFVASATVSAAGDAQVRLRLPTYFCAPNFAYLMVADAYDAVTALPGVRRAEVVLDGHFASDAINGGVAAQAGFAKSFDGEAVGELGPAARRLLAQGGHGRHGRGVCRPLLPRAPIPPRLGPPLAFGELLPAVAGRSPAFLSRQRRPRLRLRRKSSPRLFVDPATGDPVPS